MPADPVEAGRKGGRSRSDAKLAAAKRNGFQPRKPIVEQPAPAPEPVPEQPAPSAPRAFFLKTRPPK